MYGERCQKIVVEVNRGVPVTHKDLEILSVLIERVTSLGISDAFYGNVQLSCDSIKETLNKDYWVDSINSLCSISVEP